MAVRLAHAEDLTAGPILVVGAGAAGMACTIAAARGGREVLLAERAERLGGTVADALIHTIGGLFDDSGALIDEGLPGELVERLSRADPHARKRRMGRVHVLETDPALYRRTVTAWLAEEPRLRCLSPCEVSDLELTGGRILRVWLRGRDGLCDLRPAAVVDATGDAAVVRRVDPSLVEPGEALAGLVVVLRGLEPGALAFPKGVGVAREIRAAARSGELPAECATLWPDTGVTPDEGYLKLNLARDDFDAERLRAAVDDLVGWLRRLPGLATARLHRIGALGVRDGGRIQGEYRLTEPDLIAARRFPDAVCQGCWPIEHWHPEHGVQLHYLPPGTRYEVPLRALRVRGVRNLYAAGKCLSAEPRAQASARVAGTCWGMGAGLGGLLARNTMTLDEVTRPHEHQQPR
jgi:hypothetical protein